MCCHDPNRPQTGDKLRHVKIVNSDPRPCSPVLRPVVEPLRPLSPFVGFAGIDKHRSADFSAMNNLSRRSKSRQTSHGEHRHDPAIRFSGCCVYRVKRGQIQRDGFFDDQVTACGQSVQCTGGHVVRAGAYYQDIRPGFPEERLCGLISGSGIRLRPAMRRKAFDVFLRIGRRKSAERNLSGRKSQKFVKNADGVSEATGPGNTPGKWLLGMMEWVPQEQSYCLLDFCQSTRESALNFEENEHDFRADAREIPNETRERGLHEI